MIEGANLYTVFTVFDGLTATLSGLTIQDDYANTTCGGGILNFGNLTLMDDTLSNDTAQDGSGGGRQCGPQCYGAPPLSNDTTQDGFDGGSSYGGGDPGASGGSNGGTGGGLNGGAGATNGSNTPGGGYASDGSGSYDPGPEVTASDNGSFGGGGGGGLGGAAYNASVAAVDPGGDLFAELPTGGVIMMYTIATGWQPLATPGSDASPGSDDLNGNVFVDLPGPGLFQHKLALGCQLAPGTEGDASALA